jgi:DNA ligase D-like protein (predicted 3'-phosphoesterase)
MQAVTTRRSTAKQTPASPGGLDAYREKRDFARTPEPPATDSAPGSGEGRRRARPEDARPRFVVQKHRASRLHYDFRLEADGALKSWAVPRGPSLDPADKRLAVAVEDHPLDYADFEGSIPGGEYGAGEVIVWDRGAYVPLDAAGRPVAARSWAATVRRGLAAGRLSFLLQGEKLRGGWSLVRLRRGEGKDWLLIKRDDEAAAPGRDVLADGRSVLSGRTVEARPGGR